MVRFLPIIAIVAVILSAYLYLPFRRYIAYGLHISGDTTTSCCDPNTVAQSTGNFDEGASGATFMGETIDYPKTSLAQAFTSISDETQVLGTTNSAGEEKWIEVSLSEERLRAW